jgi:hypothetical protein
MTATGRLRSWLVGTGTVAAIALAAGSASALTTVWSVTTPGLEDGDACPSGTTCSVPRPLEVAGSNAVSGTISYNDVTSKVDIDITLSSASMTGADLGGSFAETNGIGEIVFTSVTYKTTASLSATEIGSQILGLGATTGTAIGTYEQLDGLGATVVAAAGFSESVSFGNFSCLVNQCGFSVGVGNSFVLGVGSSPTNYDFVHTFDVIVPEPSAGVLVGFGVLFLARRRRRG